MDVDLLISKVFVRPSIWNKWDKTHSNRSIVEKCWREISEEMDKEETILKKKWKYLRDQFSSELAKFPPARSGDAGTSQTSKWPYFESLLFLKDTVKPKTSSGNLTGFHLSSSSSSSSMAQQSSADLGLESRDSLLNLEAAEIILVEPSQCPEVDNPEASVSGISDIEPHSPVAPPVPGKKRKRVSTNSEFYNKMLELEETKMKAIQERGKKKLDDDEHFLQSLLPHMKKLSEEKRMFLKQEMMNLVCQRVYRDPQ